MTTLKEAAQQALDFIENHSRYWNGTGVHPQTAVTALREALAEQQEPVAVVSDPYDTPGLQWLCQHPPEIGTKLYTEPQPKAEQQEKSVKWVDAGNLRQLRKGDVIRVLHNGEMYYSPFRYCGVFEECDYSYYRESSQFVYLDVGMATVEKIVGTRKDFATGAVYAAKGYRVEVVHLITGETK